ncbi:MAG: hypothetical protein BWY83_01808 [bacterium ADurb.Bin478]|nr:MAG: hypothetical protein BWY83_01808 [bacterium ADurb.Bin478]
MVGGHGILDALRHQRVQHDAELVLFGDALQSVHMQISAEIALCVHDALQGNGGMDRIAFSQDHWLFDHGVFGAMGEGQGVGACRQDQFAARGCGVEKFINAFGRRACDPDGGHFARQRQAVGLINDVKVHRRSAVPGQSDRQQVFAAAWIGVADLRLFGAGDAVVKGIDPHVIGAGVRQGVHLDARKGVVESDGGLPGIRGGRFFIVVDKAELLAVLVQQRDLGVRVANEPWFISQTGGGKGLCGQRVILCPVEPIQVHVVPVIDPLFFEQVPVHHGAVGRNRGQVLRFSGGVVRLMMKAGDGDRSAAGEAHLVFEGIRERRVGGVLQFEKIPSGFRRLPAGEAKAEFAVTAAGVAEQNAAAGVVGGEHIRLDGAEVIFRPVAK